MRGGTFSPLYSAAPALQSPVCTDGPARHRYTAVMRQIPYLFLFLIISVNASAKEPVIPLPRGLTAGETATVVEVVDGDTVVLNTGKEVRLVGLQAPKLPLGRKGFRMWPLAPEAKTALERIALNRKLRLHYGGRRTDRHRRILAHLEDVNTGQWIQGHMLADGMARVYTFQDNRAATGPMLKLERRARANRRGIWRNRYYQVRQAEAAARDIGSFQLIEGQVRSVATPRNITYLNFGSDWRSDFTVMLRSRTRKALAKAGMAVESLKGKRLRVRGWVKSRNGPMIEATHPEQIELLPDRR